MSWDSATKLIAPHVVRIETPVSMGTGFLAFYNHDASWCAIATAAHVVSHADDWQQPIRIRNNGGFRLLNASDRVVYMDRINDSAVVLFVKGDFQLPQSPVALLPVDVPCNIGTEIAWLGYPNIEADTLCFFSGTVSAWQAHRRSYLIDGVAIHGVSGGPVFHRINENVQIIGCVSAYHPNLAAGAPLPGLMRAQDVMQFHAVATRIKDIDDGEAKKREFEAAQTAQAGTAPTTTGTVILPPDEPENS